MDQFVAIHKAQDAKHASPLVLVHGSWGSSAMWMKMATFFAERGWDTYAPDLRGHGKSGGTVEGATMEDYVEDVRRTITENRLNNPILVGHSMGGLVALMCAAKYGAHALVAINPSPSKEVQGDGEKKEYPRAYSPMDAGMPDDPKEVMRAFPDMPQEMLMNMKGMLGMESGVARSERKLGISVPKEALPMPVFFVGSELGGTVAFGIGIDDARPMAEYYGKEVVEIRGATHPGILLGEHAMETAERIESWLSEHE